MTKKHEELVEEIAGRIRHYKHFAEKRASTPSDRIKASFELAKLFIALVLSAVRDGRLDEELGVVGRFDFHMRRWDDFEAWVAEMLSMVGTSEFIALRPLTIEPDEPSFIAEIH